MLSLSIISMLYLMGAMATPRSKPFLPDGDLSAILSPLLQAPQKKIFYNNTPEVRRDVPVVRRDSLDPSCNIDFKLKWSAQVGSSVFSTPLIYSNTAGSNHQKNIFLSTYYQFVEMLSHDGSKPRGWPLSFEGASFASSPILYDVDGDGTIDIGLVDKNANMYWVQVGEFGKYNENFHIQVPQLKIKKEWYKGLDTAFADEQVRLSMFDRKKDLLADEGYTKLNKKPFAKPDALDFVAAVEQITYPELNKAKSRRRLEETPVQPDERESEETPEQPEAQPQNMEHHEEHFEEDAKRGETASDALDRGVAGAADGSAGGGTGDSPSPSDDYAEAQLYGYAASRHGRRKGKFLDDDFAMDYASAHRDMNDEGFVFVDPHVLGNPTLADVNKDGRVDVIMAVSYYFDKTKYPSNFTEFEPDMYVAGGVVCWDIEAQDWAWMVHLDLTTDLSHFKALIYGSPTVVDLDGDGNSEVIIGTSLGLLYVLDGDTGFTKRFFPMQFHEIQAQVAVADVMGGPDLEIIVCDMGGNVVVIDILGEILWDTVLTGQLPQTPTIGDVDGDGKLDIVVVAVSSEGSHIWVLEGDTGLPLAGYPISLPQGATISASIVLADLHDYRKSSVQGNSLLSPLLYEDPFLPPWARETRKSSLAASPSGKLNSDAATGNGVGKGSGLHLLVPSFDGHLYVINGVKGCAERIDVGEHLYSTPLIDDVSGDGFLDVVLGTMNGELMLLETNIPYHPLNAWSSFPKGRMNGFTHGQQGISVPEVQKKILKFADLRGGNALSVTFDIWDSRRHSADSSPSRSYYVAISRGLNKLKPLVSRVYSEPGRYTIVVPVNPPESSVLVIGMTNEYGQYFEDVVPIAVSTKFYVWIKYLVLAPVAALSVPLILSTSFSKPRS